ncbi:MAG: hypothetical protein IMY84_00490 [Chloroflexi bacterium]|nr:hypothetical protein [Chloroflexota bacterium]
MPGRSEVIRAARKAAFQFRSMLAILAGVALLIGLFRAAIPSSALEALFSGSPFLDSLTGAGLGSILAGNPVNSYVISEQLLAAGVSVFAIAAFIVSWVTVGVAQLPAEALTLGTRFAVLRNSLSFLLSIPIALLTAMFVALSGGTL